MTIDKKMNYEIQGGVKNYLGKQKQVTAPVKWKSSPDHPETELAYITKAEKNLLVKKDLHKSLKGGVNKGPSGIMSLNGYGSIEGGKDVGMSGTATSAAETGSKNSRDARDVQAQMGVTGLAPGVMPEQAKDYRSAAIAAGAGQRVNPGFFDSRNVVSRLELERARAFNKAAFDANRRGGLLGFLSGGGIFGNLMRGLGQALGLGKRFNEPTYDMRNPMAKFNELGLYTDRFPTDEDDEDKPFGEKLQDTSFTKNDPNAIDTNELSKALIAAQNFSIPSGRFVVDPTINTDNVMGASQNMIGPNEMADYYNSQQFMDGGIVDLVDIYD